MAATIDPSKLPAGYLEESTANQIIAFASVFIAIQIISVSLRFIAKYVAKSKFGIDDWLIIPAAASGIALCAVSIYICQYAGGGRHIIAVVLEDPAAIARFGKGTLGFATSYLVGMTLPKISMLCTFLRIFVEKWQRNACYVLIFILLGTLLGDIVANFVQCVPLPYLWDKTIEGGYCFNQNGYWRWGTFPNIITDICLLLLPIPTVWKIQLSFKDKIGVLVTFLLGGIGLIASILRFYIYVTTDGQGPTADATWTTRPEAIYSILEVAVYIAAACFPSYRAFYLTVKNKGRRTGNKPSNGYFSSSKGSGNFGMSQRSKRKDVSMLDDEDGEFPLNKTGHHHGAYANSKFERLDDAASSEGSRGGSADGNKLPSGGAKGGGIQVRSEYQVTHH